MSENDQDTALTPKQTTLITALLSSSSITEAAAAAGVNDKTARRWLKLPHFQEAYKAAQEEVFSEALASLKVLATDAIDTLKRNLSGVLVPPAVQVRAAQIILEKAIEITKVEELEARLVELEERLKER